MCLELMDAPLDPNSAAPAASDPWTVEFCRSLAAEQGRVRDFITERRQRWRQVELELVRQIEHLAGRIESLRQPGTASAGQQGGQPGEAAAPGGQPDPEGMFRRYEMALCDLRELKARNAELQKNLAAVEVERSQASRPATRGVVDWETEKRRILAALESSEELHGPEAGPNRVRIQEIVAETDRRLAEKDRQIEELEKPAEDPDGGAAVAAREEVLDRDATVRQEREDLRRLQEEWREKLRQAEVDLSVQRAKLARQEAEIDEKLRRLESSGGRDGDSPGAPQTPEKPPRGRWLSLLGLSADDPPPNKR